MAFLTPEQYLEIERKAEFKSEFYNGEMYPLDEPPFGAGTRESNILLVTNLVAGLHVQLRAGPCRVYSTAMAVGAPELYPDVAVVSGDRQFLDERRDTLLNPKLLIEVLSPSTEAYDRGRKFDHYRTIESLSAYLLVSSDRVHADLFTRQSDDRWLLSSAGRMEDVLELECIGCRLALADLYENLDLAVTHVASPGSSPNL